MRSTLIKLLLSDLPDISSVIMKYDYYFEGKITTTLHLNTNNDNITDTLVIPKINKMVCIFNDTIPKLVLWDLLDKTSIIFELKTPIIQIEPLSDGRMVSSDYNGDLRIWDFQDLCIPDIIIEVKSPYDESIFAVLNNDKIAITTERYNNIEILSNTSSIILEGHTKYIRCLMECGNRLISASQDGTLRIWNLCTCEHIIKEDVINLFRFESKFISRTIDGILRIRNTLTGECENTSNYKSYGRIIILENNIIAHKFNNIIIWNTLNGNTTILEGHTDYILDISILPDGTLLSISKDDTIRIWDLQNNTCINMWSTSIYRSPVMWDSTEYRGYITLWNNKVVIDNRHEVVVWE